MLNSVAAWLVTFCVAHLITVNPTPERKDDPPAVSPYLRNIEQLTFTNMGLARAGEAYFSPDGQKVIFQAVPDEPGLGQHDYQIYTLDLQTREMKMVSTGKGACTCAFFRPDGKKIIFASSHLDAGTAAASTVASGRGGFGS